MTVLLYQHSDNVIAVPIVDDETGEVIPASTFSDAEYILANKRGKVVLRTKLGQQVNVESTYFKITLDDAVLDESVRGEHKHQLVVWNSEGDKLPPVMSGKVDVVPVIL